MSQTLTETITQNIGTLGLKGSLHPLDRNGALDQFEHFEVTPVIGEEFPSKSTQLSDIVKDDQKVKDLAILVSQRGVVFFRGQDIGLEDQKVLGKKLGELSGKPKESGLHIHPTTEAGAEKGDQISVISSERKNLFFRDDRSRFASGGWHSDITFEPVPSDYAILKVHTNPKSGGDTLWASAYEAYSRLSPPIAKLLEGLTAYHEAKWFKPAAEAFGNKVRSEERGHPLNKGEELEAIHPVIRVNPVTGWKGLFVNKEFTKRIVGVSKDESDLLLDYLFKIVNQNHDLTVRFRWSVNNPPGIGDVAIWDNRSTFHSATFDYNKELRLGDRVVSLGEVPFYSEAGKDWREARGLPAWHDLRI